MCPHSLAASQPALSWLGAQLQPGPRLDHGPWRPSREGMSDPAKVKPEEANDLVWVTESLPDRTLPAVILDIAFFGQPTRIHGHKPWPLCIWNLLSHGMPIADPDCLFIGSIFSLHSVTPGITDFPF